MNEQTQHFLKGVIDRFEGNMAVLKLDNGAEINWPKENLYAEAKEGDVVKLFAAPDGADTAEREALAKSILNELLRPKKDT